MEFATTVLVKSSHITPLPMWSVSTKSIASVESTESLSEHGQLHSADRCRINIKFLEKLKKSTPKTFQIITVAYGDETLSCAYVLERYKRFSGGRKV
ncbi:hypothetical protein TNCV_4636781 [Trichonephila clavipes]|nr:hypothetical protein TNCV_4636781 [Trichonephila clavipes]